MTRSADFLPTPEALAIKAASVLAMALRTSSGVPRLRIDMAAFGPTPLTEVSIWKSFFCGEARKAKQIFGIFADGMVSIEFDFVVEIDLFGVRGGNCEFITDAIDIEDDGGFELFSDGAYEVGDHFLRCPMRLMMRTRRTVAPSAPSER